MNIFAHTDPGIDYPAFISINVDEKMQHSIAVRSQGNGGKDVASIIVTPELLEALTNCLLDYLHKE